MPERGHHCPFLNRADARCSTHFSLEALGYAFDHCFDHYEACAVYRELLGERRERRARAHEFDGRGDGSSETHTEYGRLVQLTVAGGKAFDRGGAGDADIAVAAH